MVSKPKDWLSSVFLLFPNPFLAYIYLRIQAAHVVAVVRAFAFALSCSPLYMVLNCSYKAFAFQVSQYTLLFLYFISNNFLSFTCVTVLMSSP